MPPWAIRSPCRRSGPQLRYTLGVGPNTMGICEALCCDPTPPAERGARGTGKGPLARALPCFRLPGDYPNLWIWMLPPWSGRSSPE